MKLTKPNSHIILALDTPDRKTSYDVLKNCSDLIDAVKFNYPLILNEGIKIISDIKRDFELPLIADFKIADVPVTNNRIAKIAFEAGAETIMVHGYIGSEGILEIMEATNNDMDVIVVTELTHPGGLEFSQSHSNDFAKLANMMDCKGIQAPGTRPDRIKELRNTLGENKTIVSCGVGAQGGVFRDAISSGADYAIIGRAIYQNKDPRSAVKLFLDEIF